MAFEEIECVGSQRVSNPYPEDGIAVMSRALNVRRGVASHGRVRFIKLVVGAELAKAVSMVLPKVGVSLHFGTGAHAGQIKVSVDARDGKFVAKRNKRDAYTITLNAASTDGLFSMDFPAFSQAAIEPVFTQGKAPFFIFQASAEMLAIEE